ncbi:putative pyrophosphatase [Archaeoglobus sulfaticallidus PM70-1]|uniref:Putative pyrophosphatase n=1 Tax=Archaeoglobus sulfaticallidus PM70-1 TaxID=387631 RepID=N0BLI1_9EURY|nr:MazG nucleotide pyrophosphohydrolase domain-containing protein [Archaeoglobus sulfaticallidus]AGK61050.1 putative pyrophosphatase [Archaeoglobus sulfaticallidus PM70-1]
MDVSDLQRKIAEKYLEVDKKSGELFLLAVLFEEVGELAEAVRKNDVEAIEEELCDVMFMVLSIANYYGLMFERRLYEKYIEDDPSSRWDLRQ